MTELERNNYEIEKYEFNGEEIEFFKHEQEFWITSSEMAKALGINTSSVWKIFSRHKTLLEAHSRIAILAMGDRPREVRIFNKTASIWMSAKSNSDYAILFQEWILNLIDNIVKTGQYIEKTENLSDLEILQRNHKLVGKLIENQIDQQKKLEDMEKKVSFVDIKLIDFEKRYDDEKIITPQTKKKIRDAISEVNTATGTHWGTLYKKIWDHFNISSTTDISEKLGQKIVQWMRTNPPFSVYLNYDPEEF